MVHAVAALAAVVVFVVDLQFPPGSAIGMLYVAVILLGLWTPWQAFPVVAAAAVSVLVVADLVIDLGEGVPPAALVNRPLMVMVFALTAVLVTRSARLQRASFATLDNLADFKRALDAAAIVAITDVRGRITYVNDTFCDISGYSREELIGQDHRIVNSAYHPASFIRDLWHTIANGRVWHGEIRNRAKQGHYYWVDTTIVPFLDQAGKPYQYIAIRSDITSRKQAEDQLTRQAALARVGQMAAVLAHEIRNPLAGIKGAIEVIMSRRKADDAERPIMRDIVSRIESLGELLNDLMVFARPRPPSFAEVSVAALVHDAITLVKRDPVAGAVEMLAEGDDVTASVDAALIRATLLNLLLNAAQAMAGRGRIVISQVRDGDRVALHVRDTGPGVPADLREQIFEPFFTTKARGGGLGLSIARRTAELHGGTLTLACPEDGGTIVSLTLPIRQAGAGPTVSAS
jgi:PAS domain S-box-containing protein